MQEKRDLHHDPNDLKFCINARERNERKNSDKTYMYENEKFATEAAINAFISLK